MEREIVMQLMSDDLNKKERLSRRYIISQKWFEKWDTIMNGENNIVESNIKNLS